MRGPHNAEKIAIKVRKVYMVQIEKYESAKR